MDKKDQIKEMLGRGIPAVNIASAIGVTEGYISQLLSDQNFAMDVAAIRTADLTKNIDIDAKWDEYESRLLEKLGELINFFTKPKDVLEALRIINSAKRKSAGIPAAQGQQTGRTIALNLPVTIINHYKINMQGGVVEVEGRSLRAMDSKNLLSLMNKNKVDSIEVLPITPVRNGGSDGEQPRLLEETTTKPRKSATEVSVDSI
jgi:hypothetical protein